MTLHRARDGVDRYSGIVLNCPDCDGPFPVECYIDEGTCPLCGTAIQVTAAPLRIDDMNDPEQDQDAVQAVAETGTGTVEIASGAYAGSRGQILAVDWQRNEMMVRLESGEEVTLEAEVVFGIPDGLIWEWEKTETGLGSDELEPGEVVYLLDEPFAGELAAVHTADSQQKTVDVWLWPDSDSQMERSPAELRKVETVDGPVTVEIDDDGDDMDAAEAENEDEDDLDVLEPPRGETQEDYFTPENQGA